MHAMQARAFSHCGHVVPHVSNCDLCHPAGFWLPPARHRCLLAGLGLHAGHRALLVHSAAPAQQRLPDRARSKGLRCQLYTGVGVRSCAEVCARVCACAEVLMLGGEGENM
jgi:hypothetical protein